MNLMSKLRYLTVPDMVWLNQELTGERVSYRFDKLEEAVFTQYAYGASGDLWAQARRFVRSWDRLQPFAKGNRACAFVGLIGFLRMNDADLNLDPAEAATWMDAVVAGRLDPADFAAEYHTHTHHGAADSKAELAGVLSVYGDVAKAMAQAGPEVPLRELARTRLTGELN
ncbi:MAG: hypothetical protein Fur0036_05730 [Fimbriimonadaceae bacterium]